MLILISGGTAAGKSSVTELLSKNLKKKVEVVLLLLQTIFIKQLKLLLIEIIFKLFTKYY